MHQNGVGAPASGDPPGLWKTVDSPAFEPVSYTRAVAPHPAWALHRMSPEARTGVPPVDRERALER